VRKIKSLKIKITKKTLGKTSRIAIEMRIKNQSQRLLFFFNFSNPLKQIKIKSFKNLLKDRKFCSSNS